MRRERARKDRDLGQPAAAVVVWGCLSKVRYPDEMVARAATARHLESGNPDRDELWVYGCEHCRGWHMTKRPQPGAASVVAGDPYKIKPPVYR